MKREATVVNVNGKLMAEIVRTEACGQCRACDFGRKQKLLYPLPTGQYREGDVVTLSVSDRALTRATLLAYGLPFLCLFAGLLVGDLAFRAEWAQALTAIAFLAAGCAYIAATEKKRRRSGKYACQAHSPEDEAEDGQA